MASLVDSIKTVVCDHHPFVKIAILAVLAMFSSQVLLDKSVDPMVQNIVHWGIIFFLFGYALECVHHNLSENEEILPPILNPVPALLTGLKGLVALFPYIAIIYFGMAKIQPALTFEPWINWAIYIVALAFVASPFLVAALRFCKKLNIIDAYKIIKICAVLGDFVVAELFMVVLFALAIGIIFVPIGSAIKIMFNYGLVFDYYVCFASVFVVCCALQYMAQFHFETADE